MEYVNSVVPLEVQAKESPKKNITVTKSAFPEVQQPPEVSATDEHIQKVLNIADLSLMKYSER